MSRARLPVRTPPPEPRPHCPGCGKPREAELRAVDADGRPAYGDRAVARVFDSWRGYGAFCSQTCAVYYANAIYKARGLVLRSATLAVRGEWTAQSDGFVLRDALEEAS